MKFRIVRTEPFFFLDGSNDELWYNVHLDEECLLDVPMRELFGNLVVSFQRDTIKEAIAYYHVVTKLLR